MHRTSDSVVPPLLDAGGALDFANRPTRDAWRTAWFQLRDDMPRDGLGAMLGRQDPPHSPLTAIIVAHARTALPRLTRSTRQLDIAGSLSIALPLIGAGPGLTPSWDDLLIGFLCGLRATGGSDWSRSRFVGQFGSAMSAASAATTAISRTYIQRTVDSAGPAWIEDVLAAIAAGDLTRAYSTTARAMRVGRTSGTDMMLGVILGSSVWQSGSEVDEVLSALSCQCPQFRPTHDRGSLPPLAQRQF